MDMSRDELRRDRRALDKANDRAMRSHARVLAAAFEGDETSAPERADLVLGGLARRRFLTIGGFSVATAAVLAACGSSKTVAAVPQAGVAPSTTALADRTYSDVILLRTAASLERNALATYDAAVGLLSGAARDVARTFRSHHEAHAMALDAQVTKLGGQPFTAPNPVVADKVLTPALLLVKTDRDALQLAHALENVAAHTYQLLVPILSVPALRGVVMSIGSVEARHATVLAKALGGTPYPAATNIPAAGPTTSSTVAPATTTTVAGGVATPGVFLVPGAFEPVAATQVLLDGQVLSIAPLGPNSFMY